MTHNIIKTESYLLVVDDSEIKQNDFFYGVADGSIKPFIEIADENTVEIVTWQLNVIGKSPNKKIAAHLPLNNSSIFEGVPLLPPLEDEQSLQQPKIPVAFECEWTTKQMPEFHQDEPKTTTNPQGQTVLVGKYIY